MLLNYSACYIFKSQFRWGMYNKDTRTNTLPHTHTTTHTLTEARLVCIGYSYLGSAGYFVPKISLQFSVQTFIEADIYLLKFAGGLMLGDVNGQFGSYLKLTEAAAGIQFSKKPSQWFI